jgi:hypothetical protein
VTVHAAPWTLASMMVLAWAFTVVPAYSPSPPAAPLEPNPELDGQVAILRHTSGMLPLQYFAQSGAQPQLPASVRYVATGSYLIGAASIQAPGVLQNDSVAGTQWQSPSSWTSIALAGGSVMQPAAAVSINGQTAIQIAMNTSASLAQGGVGPHYAWWVPQTQYPQVNTLNDWITLEYSFAGPTCPVAGQCYVTPFLTNNTGSQLVSTALYVYANGQERQYNPVGGDGDVPFNVHEGHSGYCTFNVGYISSHQANGFNVTGPDKATAVYLSFEFFLPQASSRTYTLTVNGFAFGTAPLTLGPSPYGATNESRQTFVDTANLSALNPTYGYSAIVAGGYQVAVAQRAQDLNPANAQIASSTVSNGSTLATYTFTFGLPSDPGLAYSTYNLSDTLRVPGSEFSSVAFNGTSLTTAYHQQAVGVKHTYLTGISATNPGQWVGQVVYTSSQWAAIQAPSTSSGGLFAWFSTSNTF